ncbi:hypothetical protein DCC79_06470 [bacterium]|nr:hypothetical protein [Chloroflexi bacterium CFX6]RIL10935.1 MAG: hypothetical protein DCC79_06470 [bacterium]
MAGVGPDLVVLDITLPGTDGWEGRRGLDGWPGPSRGHGRGKVGQERSGGREGAARARRRAESAWRGARGARGVFAGRRGIEIPIPAWCLKLLAALDVAQYCASDATSASRR